MFVAAGLGCTPTPEGLENLDGSGSDASAEEPRVAMHGVFSPSCTDVVSVVHGFYEGSLQDSAAGAAEFCGISGPAMFVEIDIPRRADLTVEAVGTQAIPTVVVLPKGCVKDQELACSAGIPVTVADLSGGASVVLGVMLPEEDANAQRAEAGALNFGLSIQLRAVLEVGELCHPVSLGRCVGGSACLAKLEDPEHDAETYRCRILADDTCADPRVVQIDEAILSQEFELSFARTELHSDAHVHSCTGHRRPETVVRLEFRAALGESLSETGRLQISSADPLVGLALRTPGCLPEQETACAAPQEGGASVEVEGLAGLAEQGLPVFLFVEQPAPEGFLGGREDPHGELSEPYVLRMKVVDG